MEAGTCQSYQQPIADPVLNPTPIFNRLQGAQRPSDARGEGGQPRADHRGPEQFPSRRRNSGVGRHAGQGRLPSQGGPPHKMVRACFMVPVVGP